jgi:hypothetical protein
MRKPSVPTVKAMACVAFAALAALSFRPASRPSAPEIFRASLLFAPTDIEQPGPAAPADASVAGPSVRYVVERVSGGSYVDRVGRDGLRRLPANWGSGASISLVDVKGPHGVRTYMHAVTHGWPFGLASSGAIYEMTGTEATWISDDVGEGLLQESEGGPLPGVFVAWNGDLFLLSTGREIDVVRDGAVIARGEVPMSPSRDVRDGPFYVESRKGTVVLSVLKPGFGPASRKPVAVDVTRQYILVVAG